MSILSLRKLLARVPACELDKLADILGLEKDLRRKGLSKNCALEIRNKGSTGIGNLWRWGEPVSYREVLEDIIEEKEIKVKGPTTKAIEVMEAAIAYKYYKETIKDIFKQDFFKQFNRKIPKKDRLKILADLEKKGYSSFEELEESLDLEDDEGGGLALIAAGGLVVAAVAALPIVGIPFLAGVLGSMGLDTDLETAREAIVKVFIFRQEYDPSCRIPERYEELTSDAENLTRIFLARDGKIHGPYDLETVQGFIKENRVSNTDFAWIAGMKEWRELKKVLRLEQAKDVLKVIRVALVGRVSSGKSSTINAMFGKKVTKASAIPGSTAKITAFELTKHLILYDTPGLEDATNPQWSDESRKFAMEADVVLFILSGQQVTAEQKKTYQDLTDWGVPCLVVLNKLDTVRGNREDFSEKIRRKIGCDKKHFVEGALNPHGNTQWRSAKVVLERINEIIAEGKNKILFNREVNTLLEEGLGSLGDIHHPMTRKKLAETMKRIPL